MQTDGSSMQQRRELLLASAVCRCWALEDWLKEQKGEGQRQSISPPQWAFWDDKNLAASQQTKKIAQTPDCFICKLPIACSWQCTNPVELTAQPLEMHLKTLFQCTTGARWTVIITTVPVHLQAFAIVCVPRGNTLEPFGRTASRDWFCGGEGQRCGKHARERQ